jgi:hypothetical protein
VRILLVEPAFPRPAGPVRAANIPIGLLKIASYHRSLGDEVALVRAPAPGPFSPDEVKITSLFTYWSQYVWQAVSTYRCAYPSATIEVGGIYASLMPDHCAASGCDRVEVGLYRGGAAEHVIPAYDLLPTDAQVLHASRGCARHCGFCGAWRIEPDVEYRETVADLIVRKRVLFYDNNFLANPHIGSLLDELADFRLPDGGRVLCESQCGFDTRLLTPDLAVRLKTARFRSPRISWDGPYCEWPKVRAAVDMLDSAGYPRRDIYVFMLYNHDLPYAEMREKVEACRRWGVRVSDCRYRPLSSTADGYRPGPKPQAADEYYIHPGWSDTQVRRFRRTVRHQNIAIMLRLPDNRYLPGCEQRMVGAPWRSGKPRQP